MKWIRAWFKDKHDYKKKQAKPSNNISMGFQDRAGRRENKGQSLRKNKIKIAETIKKATSTPSAPKIIHTESQPIPCLPKRDEDFSASYAIIDAGANLVHRLFDNDLEQVIQRAKQQGVEAIIVNTTNFDKIGSAIDFCKSYSGLYFAGGIHPDSVKRTNNEKQVQQKYDQLKEFLVHPNAVAVTCGLNFAKDFSLRFGQEKLVEKQIETAKDLKLPLIFTYDPEAIQSLTQLIATHRHSIENGCIFDFVGTESDLQEFLNLDLYIAITGAVCDSNSPLKQVISKIPQNRILLASNSPSNTPQNIDDAFIREAKNEPSNLAFVVPILAECYKISEDSMASILRANTLTFYKISEYSESAAAEAAAVAEAFEKSQQETNEEEGNQDEEEEGDTNEEGDSSGNIEEKKSKEKQAVVAEEEAIIAPSKKSKPIPTTEVGLEEDFKSKKNKNKKKQSKVKLDEEQESDEEGRKEEQQTQLSSKKNKDKKKKGKEISHEESEDVPTEKSKSKKTSKKLAQSDEEEEEEVISKKKQKGKKKKSVSLDEDEDEQAESKEPVNKSNIIELNAEEEEEEILQEASSSTKKKRELINSDSSSIPSTLQYVCKMCRCKLFTSDETAKHDPKNATQTDDGKVDLDKICNSHFITSQVSWISSLKGDEGDENKGTMECPQCKTKLGKWNEIGDQCSCGVWVAPSYKILKNRVEIIYPEEMLKEMSSEEFSEEEDDPKAPKKKIKKPGVRSLARKNYFRNKDYVF